MSTDASSNSTARHAAKLVDKVSNARDDMGIIKEDALHNQLSKLTANDWRAVSAAFPKNEKDPDGFYITDENNQVSIHNDMRKADKTAHESLLKGSWDLTKDTFEVPGALAFGGTWGALQGYIGGGLVDLTMPTGVTAVVGESAAAVAGAIAGPALTVAGVGTYLYLESRHEKKVAG